jgi:glycine oxidase
MDTSYPQALVVGAGVVGRSVGYYLSRRDFAVALIDASPSGTSDTSRASLGVITHFNGGDNPLSRFYRDSHEGFSSLSAELREETGVDIGWREPGGIDLIITDEDEAQAEETLTFNRERGCPAERVEGDELRRMEPGLGEQVRAGVYFPGDHRVDPEKLSEGLLRGLQLRGGTIDFDEELLEIEAAGNGRVLARTSEGERPADFLVLAAGSWSRGLGEKLGATIPVRPIRGQHCRFAGGEQVRHILRHGGHHLLPVEERIAVGTTVEEVGFDTSITTEAADIFEAAFTSVLTLPCASGEQRAGLRPKPKGGRPLIGPLTEHPQVFAATGHYKNGVLMGPLTGQVSAEWMATGEAPRDMSYFAPER